MKNSQPAMKTRRLPLVLAAMALGTIFSYGQSSAATGNPLMGNWTLVTASDAASCANSLTFTADTYTTVWNGVTTKNHATYAAYPGYVNVVSGNDISHYQQYNLTSPGIITNVTGNQYAIANCPYKKM
jgi:hypothetical protein